MYFHFKGKPIHKLILPDSQEKQECKRYIDHKNQVSWDNRKENLRLCSPHQNCFNRGSRVSRSKYRGVTWSETRRKWIANIKFKSPMQIGSFDTKTDAAIAYDIYSRIIHGEFGQINISNPSPEQRKRILLILIKNEQKRLSKKQYGVSFCKTKNRWLAEFRHNKKLHFIGYFKDNNLAYQKLVCRLKELNLEFLLEKHEINRSRSERFKLIDTMKSILKDLKIKNEHE